jgi:hypothetical protein
LFHCRWCAAEFRFLLNLFWVLITAWSAPELVVPASSLKDSRPDLVLPWQDQVASLDFGFVVVRFPALCCAAYHGFGLQSWFGSRSDSWVPVPLFLLRAHSPVGRPDIVSLVFEWLLVCRNRCCSHCFSSPFSRSDSSICACVGVGFLHAELHVHHDLFACSCPLQGVKCSGFCLPLSFQFPNLVTMTNSFLIAMES